MFSIDVNHVIRINKGDDSGDFVLDINMGTTPNPVKYDFYAPISIEDKSEGLEVTADITEFRKQVEVDGMYYFEYKSGGWYLADAPVDLILYGIVVSGIISIGSHFTVAYYENSKTELYFLVYGCNSFKHPCLKKSFRTDGLITTERMTLRGPQIDTSFHPDIVTEDHNMLLSIDSKDTMFLERGEYKYVLKIKFLDVVTKDYKIDTVTNRYSLYLLDDNFIRNW